MEIKVDFKERVAQNPVLAKLAECAYTSGTEAYVVGGYVRDAILGRPCKDIDVVCLGSGVDFATHFAQTIGKPESLTVYKNFGTAMLRYLDSEVEFVGARKESYRAESRKPIVENGTLQDDQCRRDFTVNALAFSINKGSIGTLTDPFGGLQDLHNRIIRTPLNPDITFSDDPLRIMRAVRFAAQLGFDIEPDTFDAIIRNVERIRIVSMERIHTELNKIILSPKPSYGFKLLDACGLLNIIFPELVELKGVEIIEGKGHKDNFYHTLQVLDNVAEKSDDLWLRWSALLHDIAKPATKKFYPKIGWTFHGHEDRGARMVPKIFARLKLPLNEKMKMVQKLVRLHLRPIPLVRDEITDSALRRLLFDAGDDLEALMLLCKADVTSKNDVKVKRYIKNFEIVEEKLREVEEKDRMRNFQPAVTGEHIMQVFNLPPGKDVGIIKTAVREAILDGSIGNNFEESHALMLKIGQSMGLSPVV